MATPRRVSTRRAILSYEQIKRLTDWSNLLVKDYQGILQDFEFTANEIDTLEVQVIINTDNIATNAEEIADITPYFDQPVVNVPKWRAVSVSSSYAMVGWDFVNAKLGSEVLFPLYPEEGDQVAVRNGDGTNIKLNGNGKKINGSFYGAIQQKGTSITFCYFIDESEWFAR